MPTDQNQSSDATQDRSKSPVSTATQRPEDSIENEGPSPDKMQDNSDSPITPASARPENGSENEDRPPKEMQCNSNCQICKVIHRLEKGIKNGWKEERPCAFCFDDTTEVCPDCIGAISLTPSETLKTFFCGPRCLDLGWAEHKDACFARQNRRYMYRAVTIAHMAFESLLRVLNNLPISFINKEPREKVIGLRIALSYKQHRRALVFGHKLLYSLLRGIAGKFEDVVITNRRPPMIDFFSSEFVPLRADDDDDDDGVDHIILKLTLWNDECYGIDLTSSQFGHFDEPVLPWVRFFQTRIACAAEPYLPSGQQIVHMALRRHCGDTIARCEAMWLYMSLFMHEVLSQAMTCEQGQKELYLLPSADYERCGKEFISYVEGEAIWLRDELLATEDWYDRVRYRAIGLGGSLGVNFQLLYLQEHSSLLPTGISQGER